MPISFDHVVELIDLLGIEGSPYKMIIDLPTMRKLNGAMYRVKWCFSLEKDVAEVFIPLVYEYVSDEHPL